MQTPVEGMQRGPPHREEELASASVDTSEVRSRLRGHLRLILSGEACFFLKGSIAFFDRVSEKSFQSQEVGTPSQAACIDRYFNSKLSPPIISKHGIKAAAASDRSYLWAAECP